MSNQWESKEVLADQIMRTEVLVDELNILLDGIKDMLSDMKDELKRWE